MIIFLKIFLYVTLFFFSFLFPERYAFADGKVFLETDEDAWIVGKELAQRAVISHKDGIQKLDIAIEVEAKGLSGLWLFPVPAMGKDISLDVKNDFKIPKGSLYTKVKQDTVESFLSSSFIYFSGFLFGGSGRIFILRSLVSTLGVPCVEWLVRAEHSLDCSFRSLPSLRLSSTPGTPCPSFPPPLVFFPFFIVTNTFERRRLFQKGIRATENVMYGVFSKRLDHSIQFNALSN